MQNRGLLTTKSVIDSIYSVVTSSPDGYNGSMWNIDKVSGGKISTELQRRGVLKKTKVGPHLYNWKWYSNAMSPTSTFVKSVYESVNNRRKQERIDKKMRDKMNAEPTNVVVYPEIKTTPVAPIKVELEAPKETVIPACSIEEFSSQELWDELKRRGWEASNGELTRITRMQ